MPSYKVICLILALVFFLCAAFNFPRRSTLTGEAALWPISWRDLGYAFVVLSFLV